MSRFEVTHDEFRARLRRYVEKRVRSSSDADDVVQTVLLRLLETQARGALASPHAWVTAAARSAIVDVLRARARPDAAGTEDVEAGAAPEVETRDEASECLVPLLALLSAEERSLLERVDVGGEAQSALSRELGLSASGMKSRVQRARARLRDLVLARCQVERDARGEPTGPATCRTRTGNVGRERCCEPEPAPFNVRPCR